jgi:hypothetical protein
VLLVVLLVMVLAEVEESEEAEALLAFKVSVAAVHECQGRALIGGHLYAIPTRRIAECTRRTHTLTAAALLAFQASGGVANNKPLASWRSGTDPCSVGAACGHPLLACPWAGVSCSGGVAPAVTKLVLHGGGSGKFDGVVGDVGALAPLTRLAYLDLTDTNVAGDVRGLAPLTQLTELKLANTKVSGQAATLAPLTKLTLVTFGDTAVVGSRPFCAASGPFHARCDPQHGVAGCGCYC